MKKFLAAILVAFMLAALPLAVSAKYRVAKQPAAAAENDSTDAWYLQLLYTKIYDNNFGSDAITGEAGLFIFRGLDVSMADFWGDANLSVGPFFSLSWNSGLLNSTDYAENIQMWTGGAITAISFPKSVMTFNALFGQLFGKFTYASGYVNYRKDWFLAGKLSYESAAGRMTEQWFFPAWKMSIAGSYPQAPQRAIDWGYRELTHRLGDFGTNTYSLHATADLGLFDIPLGGSIVIPLTARGFGGKYNENIKYLGLGGGTAFIFNKKTAAIVTVDKIWGWENSKFNNWAINFALNLSFFQQLW
ncbi:MAG: hypothetical protein WCO55_02530 [Candidatus Falkowbacteria bacterium]